MRRPNQRELEQVVASVREPSTGAVEPERRGAPSGDVDDRADVIAVAVRNIPGLAELRDAAEQVQSRRAEAVRQRIGDSKQTAVARAEAVVRNRAGLFDEGAPEADGVAPEIEPTLPVEFIRSTPGASLHDQHIAEGDTWAKWECSVSSGGVTESAVESLSFFYLWENSIRRDVHVNITAGMSLRGHAHASADGNGFPASLFFPDGRVDVAVHARLTIWPLWLPHTAQPFHTFELARCGAEGGTTGDADTAPITTTTALHAVRYYVPRRAYILIEASIVADLRCMSGTGAVDFATADAFGVDFPYCFVTPD